MNKLKQITNNLDLVKRNHKNYQLPEFIKTLREAMYLSRQTIVDDLKIPYNKLFYLECGGYFRGLDQECFERLGEYFGIENEIMNSKINNFGKYNKNIFKDKNESS